MDSEIIISFLNEAVNYLPIIRQSIDAYQKDNKQIDQLDTAYRHIHTVNGALMMIGLADLGETAKELEDELEALNISKNKLSVKKHEQLIMKISLLEIALIDAKDAAQAVNLDEASIENTINSEIELEGFTVFEDESEAIEGLSDESFELDAEGLEIPEEDFKLPEEDFELDEEMLEIFKMEAEDLLRSINAQLEILENNPNQREALMEIRRNAHTLKGAAGICGFKKISDLSHRMEDLLDYLADHNVESNAEVFDLLFISTDYLERFANGDDINDLNEKITEIYKTFDEVLAKLQTPVIEVTVEEPKVIAEEPKVLLESVPIIDETEDFILVEPEIEEEVVEDINSTQISERAVVRVSLERLDELVKLVGEMVSSRSVFEQRLNEFESQISELQHSTGRLRRSTNRLEVDFEAKALKSSPLIFSSFATPNAGFSSIGLPKETFQEFDSLEFDQYTEFHQTTRELIETAGDTGAISSELDVLLSNLETLFSGQRRMIDEMQDKLMRLRMVKLESLTKRLQRTVRVTANQEGKLADFILEGERLEIDTQILDTIAEPLLHLLRNAVSHGIETAESRKMLGKNERGTIKLRGYSEGTHIVIKVSDDGKGISADKLKQKAIVNGFITQAEAAEMSEEDALELVFVAGFSTAEKLSQVSGRGVGMDIVKTNLLRRQGEISIESEQGKGTTFTMRIPMAVAVTRSILVKVNGQTFAFPLSLVKQVVETTHSEIGKAKEKGGMRLGNTTYEVSQLNELLNLPKNSFNKDAKMTLLLIETPDKSIALAVDQALKPREIVIKPLTKPLQNLREILGATILGDGSVVPVLDLIYLLKRKPRAARKQKAAEQKVKTQISVMVVDDSPSVRRIMSNLIRSTGWQPIVAKDGLEALDLIQGLAELPDVILTDVEMPRMDGYELLASLNRQENLRKIPVVMITSRAGDKHRQKAYELGVSEYLTKPYEDSILTETIHRLALAKF
jgi:chemosensory pili system protein ChpA (sensor histidine kinase/response regulator)